MKELLTFDEAGEQLGVPQQTLKKMLQMGNLPEAEKIRRQQDWIWVLPKESIEIIAKHPDIVINLQEKSDKPLLTFNDVASVNKDFVPQDDAPATNTVPRKPLTPKKEEKCKETTSKNETVRHLSIAKNSHPATNTSQYLQHSPYEEQSAEELIDLALLDRLLAVQEAKAEARAHAEQSEYILKITKTNLSLLEEELEEERAEHTTTQEQLREEILNRKLAEAKIADLNEQLIREINLAESERQQRSEAITSTIEADRRAAQAVSSLGHLARRRYLKSLNNRLQEFES